MGAFPSFPREVALAGRWAAASLALASALPRPRVRARRNSLKTSACLPVGPPSVCVCVRARAQDAQIPTPIEPTYVLHTTHIETTFENADAHPLGDPLEQVLDPSAVRRLAHILKSQFPSTFTMFRSLSGTFENLCQHLAQSASRRRACAPRHCEHQDSLLTFSKVRAPVHLLFNCHYLEYF